MGRRRRRRDDPETEAQRDLSAVARSILLRPLDLRLVEDRRLYHPLQDEAPARSLRRKSDAFVTMKPRGGGTARPSSLVEKWSYANPMTVTVCQRRKRRRETLFAMRRTGKGAKARRRRNALTEISCK